MKNFRKRKDIKKAKKRIKKHYTLQMLQDIKKIIVDNVEYCKNIKHKNLNYWEYELKFVNECMIEKSIEELKRNLVTDFEKWLQENEKEIVFNWIIMECCINDFLEQKFYNIGEYIQDYNKQEELKNNCFETLDTYCSILPF